MAAGAPAIPADPEPSLLEGLIATRRLARQTLAASGHDLRDGRCRRGGLPLGDAIVAIPIKVCSLAAFVAVILVTRAMTRGEFAELRRFVLEMVPARRTQPAG